MRRTRCVWVVWKRSESTSGSAPNANVATRGLRAGGATVLRCSFDEAPGRKLLGETRRRLPVAHPRPCAAAGRNVCRLVSVLSVLQHPCLAAVPSLLPLAWPLLVAPLECSEQQQQRPLPVRGALQLTDDARRAMALDVGELSQDHCARETAAAISRSTANPSPATSASTSPAHCWQPRGHVVAAAVLHSGKHASNHSNPLQIDTSFLSASTPLATACHWLALLHPYTSQIAIVLNSPTSSAFKPAAPKLTHQASVACFFA